MGLPSRGLVPLHMRLFKGQLGFPHSIVAGFGKTVNETSGILQPGP